LVPSFLFAVFVIYRALYDSMGNYHPPSLLGVLVGIPVILLPTLFVFWWIYAVWCAQADWVKERHYWTALVLLLFGAVNCVGAILFPFGNYGI